MLLPPQRIPGTEPLFDSVLFDDIIARLKNARAVQVVGHLRPDGDCIGSLLAMRHILLHYARPHALACEKIPPSGYVGMEDYSLITERADPGLHPDLIVYVDCASRERALSNYDPELFRIVIDHHVSNTRFGDLHWIEPRCAATCEMLFHFCAHANIPLTPALAEALLVGLTTDTGGFRFGNTGPTQHLIAAQLLDAGATAEKVSRMAFNSATPESLRLAGHVMYTMQILAEGALAWAEIRSNQYDSVGGESHAGENLGDVLRSVRGVRVGVLFHEIAPDTLRANFRSDGTINVSKIACEFGGGGHVAAAGLTLKTANYESDRDRILERVLNELD